MSLLDGRDNCVFFSPWRWQSGAFRSWVWQSMPAAVQGPTVEATSANSPRLLQWLVVLPLCCWWVSQWYWIHLFGFLGFMQGFINKMVYGSRWEAIWVQSSLASNVFYTLAGNCAVRLNLAWIWDLCHMLTEIRIWFLFIWTCAQRVKFAFCVRMFRMSPRQGWTPTLVASCGTP